MKVALFFIFLQSIAPVDLRNFAVGTAAVFSALSGSATATQTAPITLTNCLWTLNVLLQVRLLFGSQLESLHKCHQLHWSPKKLVGSYVGNIKVSQPGEISWKEWMCPASLSGQRHSQALLRSPRALWQSFFALFRKLVQWLFLHVLQWALHFWRESVWWEGWLWRPVRWEELQCERMLEPQSQWMHTGLPGSHCRLQGKLQFDQSQFGSLKLNSQS